MGQRESLAALIAVTLILLIVILPLTLILSLVVREAAGVYGQDRGRRAGTSRISFAAFEALPSWATDVWTISAWPISGQCSSG